MKQRNEQKNIYALNLFRVEEILFLDEIETKEMVDTEEEFLLSYHSI